MIARRLACLFALPALLAPRIASAGATTPPNCGDPGGRFLSCEAIAAGLPPRGDAPARCALCGGRHAALPAP